VSSNANPLRTWSRRIGLSVATAMLGLLGQVMAGCASDGFVSSQCAAPGTESKPAFACAASPACKTHLDAIQELVYQRWRPARPLPQRGDVRVRFRLDATGKLSCAEVLQATRGLGGSCLAALKTAELPPLPEELRSIANVDLEATFRYERAY